MDREGFRNRLQQYKKAREENPGLKYWEWKNLPKYDEGGEVEIYESELPEITVIPEEWQKDFSKNFGTAKIRRNIYRGMPRAEILHLIKLENLNFREQLNKTNLTFSTEDRRAKAIMHKQHLSNVEKIVARGKQLNDDPNTPYTYTYDQIKRLYNVWNIAGRPEITSEGSLFPTTRAHWVPVINKLYNVDTLHETIAELAHPILAKFGNRNKWYQFIYDAPRALYGNFSKDYSAYDDKNHYEYDTHRIVEPDITEYILYGKGTKYLNGFAEGGEVTGPPTYEDWYADVTKYNPTIWDNYSLEVSLDAAKKALHNEAMELPGYAPMWNEYVRTLPKAEPSISEFVDDLWLNENPNNTGYRRGRYYPHKSPEGGAMTIGPGFKLGSGSHNISDREAYSGMTKNRLNQEARKIGKKHLNAVNLFLNQGQTTNPADTVSPQIKMGLMDLRHQVGPLGEWKNLRDAVLTGDIDKIKKESTVTWDDNGVTRVDKRRKKIRDTKYFYY